MEAEFLDLIKTFEKTAKRLETLDSTILNFKDVVEGLRENLDELVEMVQLEEIVELSEKGSLKIQSLHQNLDQVSESYERLLQVDQFKDEYLDRLTTIEEKMIRLSECETISETYPREIKGSSSTFALEDWRYVYYIEAETHQLMVLGKELGDFKGAVENIVAKKLVRENDTVFALVTETGDIIALNGLTPTACYPLNATDFVVIGYELYYLSELNLIRYHLLTLEKEIILNNVVSVERLNHQLICQTEDKRIEFVNLLEK